MDILNMTFSKRILNVFLARGLPLEATVLYHIDSKYLGKRLPGYIYLINQIKLVISF